MNNEDREECAANDRDSDMKLTGRTKQRRLRERGSREWPAITKILDAGFVAHVGFCIDQQPIVIPTMYGRDGDSLYLHGSVASHMLRELATGIRACVTVSLIDGLVLSRSAFDHSMNYRSVIAFGTARKIVDPSLKLKALQIMADHMMAGRWAEVRGPSDKELNATTVLELTIEEASSKERTGPPQDAESDAAGAVWAGVLPLEMKPCSPIPDGGLVPGVEVPSYVLNYAARLSRGVRKS
jgi:nitroimidazol reductase NimA-like FMN-containing flavoprotein (pyridoxamine 5'-phosphate oxidase superfamily)